MLNEKQGIQLTVREMNIMFYGSYCDRFQSLSCVELSLATRRESAKRHAIPCRTVARLITPQQDNLSI